MTTGKKNKNDKTQNDLLKNLFRILAQILILIEPKKKKTKVSLPLIVMIKRETKEDKILRHSYVVVTPWGCQYKLRSTTKMRFSSGYRYMYNMKHNHIHVRRRYTLLRKKRKKLANSPIDNLLYTNDKTRNYLLKNCVIYFVFYLEYRFQ